MKAGQKMTRAGAEKALKAGTLSPQTVLSDLEGFPNRHVRLKAFRMTGQAADEKALENISKAASDRVAELKDNPELFPKWIQKFLTPQT